MVEQCLDDHAFFGGIEDEELFVRPHHGLCDGHFLLGEQRLAEQLIRFFRAGVGYGIIVFFIINGIDLCYLGELQDVDGLILLCLDLLQVIIRHHHIFIFLIFVPFDDIIRADFLVAVAAVFLIFDACLALLIKLVKVDVIVYGGLIQAHGDQDKPHGDGAFVCNSHRNPFFLFRISVCNLGIFIQDLTKRKGLAYFASPIFFITCL